MRADMLERRHFCRKADLGPCLKVFLGREYDQKYRSMNRNLKILAVLCLLLGVLIWLYRCGPLRTSTERQGSWDRAFRIEDTRAIGKVFLVRKTDGATVTLVRRGNDWYVNDRYKANPNVVENLLQAMQGIRLKYIPPQAALDHIVKDLATRSIKVQVFDRGGKLMKTYYVGGAPPDERGTYMIMEGAEQPYVMELPGLGGSVRGRYDIFKLDRWRDKTILSFDPEQIEYVAVDYPKQRSKSFELKREGRRWTLTPLYATTPPRAEQPDVRRIQRFLSGFRQVYGETFLNEWNGRDSVRQILPFAQIEVRTPQAAQVVTLWPIERYVEGRALPVVERYYVDVRPAGDFMIAQHRLLAKILWAYEFFFSEQVSGR